MSSTILGTELRVGEMEVKIICIIDGVPIVVYHPTYPAEIYIVKEK